MKQQRVRTAALAALIVIISAGTAVFSTDASARPSGQAGAGSTAPKSDAVAPPSKRILAGNSTETNNAAAAADAVKKYASANSFSIFAGVELTNDGNDLTIFLTKLDPAAESTLSAQVGASVPVTFKVLPTTVIEQDALHDKVTAAVDDLLKTHNIKLVEWGLDSATGRDFADVYNLNQASSEYLKSRFDQNLELTSVSFESIHPAASRQRDVAPWNGGDFISSAAGFNTPPYTDCSSGVPVHNSGGGQYLITAGHCFVLGTTVYNNASEIPFGGVGPRMATVSNEAITTGQLDAELVSAVGSTLLWTGSSNAPGRTTIAGTQGVAFGQVVCVDGAFEGQGCDDTVNGGPNICVSLATDDYGTRYVCHLLQAVGTNVYEFGQGDSGGPIFSVNGGLKVVGTLTGFASGVAGYSYTSCVNWTPLDTLPRMCANDYLFTYIGNELAYWSLTVN